VEDNWCPENDFYSM